MFQQTAWAAMRNLTQIYAQTVGGANGIHIIQVTQLFNIMGSAGGYQLAANSYIAVLADPEKRTSLFGVLSGMTMLGASAGYTCEWRRVLSLSSVLSPTLTDVVDQSAVWCFTFSVPSHPSW